VEIAAVPCKNSRHIGWEVGHRIETQRLGSRMEGDQHARGVDVESACESRK
jgi:hypothetical protein